MVLAVIDLFDNIVYVLACPECGETAWEIYLEDFDISSCVSKMRCLECDKVIEKKVACVDKA